MTTQLRPPRRAGLAALALALALGGTLAAQSDIFAQLGTTETEARGLVFQAFSSGNVYLSGANDVFKAASAEARVAMVKAVVGFARSYTATPDFAARYARFREEQKPDEPEGVQSGDQMRAEQRKALEEGIKNAEQMAKQMPNMKKEMDELAAQLKEQLKAVGADAEQNKMMDQMMKQAGQQQAANHQQALAKWEKEYPVDFKPMVAARLRDFLAASATVDFAATTALDPRDKKQHFTNKAYEQKDAQWKLMYRAGKPAVDAARAAASDWLKAIGG